MGKLKIKPCNESAAAIMARHAEAYSDDQARDDSGKWSSGGGGGAAKAPASGDHGATGNDYADPKDFAIAEDLISDIKDAGAYLDYAKEKYSDAPDHPGNYERTQKAKADVKAAVDKLNAHIDSAPRKSDSASPSKAKGGIHPTSGGGTGTVGGSSKPVTVKTTPSQIASHLNKYGLLDSGKNTNGTITNYSLALGQAGNVKVATHDNDKGELTIFHDNRPKKEANPMSTSAELVRGHARNENAFSSEAAVDDAARTVEVIIISEGPGNEVDKNYYTPEAIESGVKLFEGARAFINHQTEAERGTRPEQDVHQLCGFYKDCKLTTVNDPKQGKTVKALQATLVCDESEAGSLAFSKAKAQILYSKIYPGSKDCYAGISVNTGGWQDGTVEIAGDEWAKIVAFEGVQSADIVTRPGRGGAFLRFAESLRPEGLNNNKESEVKNAQAIKHLVTKLEESDKAIKAETDGAKKKIMATEGIKVREELQKLLLEDEAFPPKAAADDTGAAGAGHDDAGADMDLIKKLIPQNADESEADYGSRIDAIKGHFGKGEVEAEAEGAFEPAMGADEKPSDKPKMEAARSRESASVSKFRKESPNLYRAMMASLRESLGAERLDFKGVKEDNAKLRTEVSGLRLERDLAEAERSLGEAGIPAQYLAPADLVRLEEGERTRLIERTKMIMESAGASHVWSGSGPAVKGKETGLDFGSLPTVAETK